MHGGRIETRSVLQDLESEFEENLALIDRIIGIREARALEAEGQLELIREPELTRPLTVFLNLVEDSFEDAAYRCFMEDRHGPTCPRPRPPT